MEYQACKAWSNLRPLGRTVWSDDALALFWTGSGIECMTDSSELWLEMRADFDQYEPWISVELDGAWFLRMPVPKGESRVCLFRGLTTRRPRRVRILKDVQPMQADPSHLLLFTAMADSHGGGAGFSAFARPCLPSGIHRRQHHQRRGRFGPPAGRGLGERPVQRRE